jgi:PHP family Zn ribbon phosphoesterase
MDKDYAYIPIRKIKKKQFQGTVYNLEIKDDNSYSTWVATVHNCWTPWFSLFGSKSGFDSIEECFGELADNIYAIETGLSSDPIMNWQIKDLDTRAILSFSDAHSGPKLGRETTVFVSTIKQSNNETMDFSYQDVAEAIKQTAGSKLKISYTIEFFPEEGKYHWSGHRVCNIKYNPQQVKEKGQICPVCQKPLTIGVENRVADLSYRLIEQKDLIFIKNGLGVTFVYDQHKKRKPFVSFVPLLEVLTEVNNGSQIKALREYESLISSFATEFEILLKKPYEEIEKVSGKKLREAIQIVRERKVFVDPGYDGVFGIVKIFNNERIGVKESLTDRQPRLF